MELEKNQNEINITESQLQALYLYISMYFDEMNDSEKEGWHNIMKEIDKEFYDQD